ncbi:hypothetical protein JYT85_01170 [Desulfocapsa sp. AH-315-G09]|uniref:Uncharacterized protein n=1 Tax=Desulfotalea psychrophila TaxID=84980 RepID=A0ABS3ATG2_9BACT|nr:hypothetical protein [Desulfocapsa sp.]MBN4065243.1 hypothetical protein [Desulfocapsa sp. AH-315-G09]MBN4068058.1 hypothetical protein [Desulfotalea psychrophila]
MNEYKTEEMTALVHNRLFRGGRIGHLWRVFRGNQLSGIFQISGDGQACNLEIVQGTTARFSFEDQQDNRDSDKTLERLKHFVRKTDVRFSIYVAP